MLRPPFLSAPTVNWPVRFDSMSTNLMTKETPNAVALVPGRSCGDCSLCCKLTRIKAFDKPPGVWCAHCAPGRGGCTIYDTRPSECRDFYCDWRITPALGEEWRPNKCRMFLCREGNVQTIHVDPSDPGAWRREPFFRQIKTLAARAVGTEQQVAVRIKDRVIVVFPHKEVDVGTMNPGDQLVVREMVSTAGRRDWVAFIERAPGG
jgi:hypothetical protein